MKILHVIESLRAGGKERQLVELLKGLLSYKDIACELAVMSHDAHYASLSTLNIRIHHLIRSRGKDPKLFLKLFRLCKQIRPDIVHTWGSMPSVYAVPIAKILGMKLVNGMIRDAPPKLKLFDKERIRLKFTFPFSDKIVSNSYAGLESYKVSSQKAICIHNAFDFERLKNLQDKDILKRKTGIFTDNVVGMVASFSHKKDYATFLAAAEMVLEYRDDVTFLAIGDGENLEKCMAMVRPQVFSHVKFLGKQSDVESFVNMFDIGVLATYSEGISNSILEYMALGKPVVASDNNGTRELVVNGKTGFLVTPNDIKDLHSKIKLLLDRKNLATRMGNRGRDQIARFFSLEKMTLSFIDLYKTLV